MSYEGVPGLVETRDDLGETTLVVDPARLVEACLHLRDEEGFNLLLDITATDYLGWGDVPVAGYMANSAGRDLNYPAAQGYARTPEPKPKRFTLSYHLLRVADDSARVRVQVWRHPFRPECLARRGYRARGVDDVEMRCREHPVWWGEGRCGLRSAEDEHRRIGAAHAPVYGLDLPNPRT